MNERQRGGILWAILLITMMMVHDNETIRKAAASDAWRGGKERERGKRVRGWDQRWNKNGSHHTQLTKK